MREQQTVPVSSNDGTINISTRKMREDVPYPFRVQGKKCQVVKTSDGAIEICELKNSPNWPLLAIIALTVAIAVRIILQPVKFGRLESDLQRKKPSLSGS